MKICCLGRLDAVELITFDRRRESRLSRELLEAINIFSFI
jgi:hypothetical protein